MGFISRLLVPRGVRRAMHPVRTVKYKVTPRPIREVKRAAHPVDNALYSLDRKLRSKR